RALSLVSSVFTAPAPTALYTLSLHDALPISMAPAPRRMSAISSIAALLVDDEPGHEQVAHAPLAGDHLNPPQHLRPKPDKRGRILQVGDLHGAEIAVQNVDDPRQKERHIVLVRHCNFQLGREVQVSASRLRAQRDYQWFERHEGD